MGAGMSDPRIRAIILYEPVDPANPEHVVAADEANAEIRRNLALRDARNKARLADESTGPLIRVETKGGAIDFIFRHEAGRMYTRLPGSLREVGWTLDGDVWRCDLYGHTIAASKVPR